MNKITNHTQNVAIWWVKRDFRLKDNEALSKALEANQIVIPIFLFEPLLMHGSDWGDFHTAAIHSGAASLSNNLEYYNSKLLCFDVSLFEALHEIKQKLSANGFEVTRVYSHEETGLTHTFNRDKEFKVWCRSHNIVWHEYTNNGVIRWKIDRNYWERHFVSYMTKDRFQFPKLKLTKSFPETIKKLFSNHDISHVLSHTAEHSISERMNVSERSGNFILRDFLYNRGKKYTGGISSMNRAIDSCSRLSAQIAWGSLSLRTVLQECDKRISELEAESSNSAKQWRLSLGNFRSRLFWHAHFVQKLENQVDMEFYAVNKAFRSGLPYISPETSLCEHNKRLQAWLHGETGFPAIDAAMRYYQKYGWLNFRSRAMITSFACNALRLPWQTVLYALSKLMIDYVPGIHVSQVQMQAGVTGINTIRVYSPQKQLEDHDPKCHFVYRMIPELKSLKPAQILSLSSGYTHSNYTAPIIDFKKESRIMKDALYEISKSKHCADESKKVFIKHGSRRRNFSSRSKPGEKLSRATSAQLKLF